MSAHFVTDTEPCRPAHGIALSPDTIVSTAIVPIIMLLLFVYVLGGAIRAGTDTVRQLPARLLSPSSPGSGTSTGSSSTARAASSNVFRSMPIAGPRCSGRMSSPRWSPRSPRWRSSSVSRCSWASDPARAFWRGSPRSLSSRCSRWR